MPTAYLVAGLGYGDEGKGATVDFLVRSLKAQLVVRYNGGAQAGHNVVTLDGRHHTFSQFGSGTFVPGVRTYLSKYMMVNPLNMMLEEKHLRSVGVTDAFQRIAVDARALITTPFQSMVNKILQKVSGKHNSCGMGIGQTREDYIAYGDSVLFVGDTREPWLKAKLQFLQAISLDKIREYLSYPSIQNSFPGVLDTFLSTKKVKEIVDEYRMWPVTLVYGSRFFKTEDVIFEGAQGVLLDEDLGEEGYNTWTKTTFSNAFDILKEAGWSGDVHRIGVLRTYQTRHGDGPLGEEYGSFPKERHNEDIGAQGRFRKGRFSFEALDRALDFCGGVDSFALNHIDEVNNKIDLTPLVYDLERRAPVSIISGGPTAEDRHFRMSIRKGEMNDSDRCNERVNSFVR